MAVKREAVWAVSMVRDEADIIGYTLRHLLAQDVDGIIVADNRSIDGTRDVLADCARGAGIPFRIVDDPETAYYQGRKMTRLAGMAHEAGASWIIPFDADELWTSTSHSTVGAALRDQPWSVLALRVPRWDYVCTSMDGDSPDPYERIQHRKAEPHRKSKVAYRHRPGLQIRQGNHGISEHGRYVTPSDPAGVEIRHFPYRSFGQFMRKARNGYEALQDGNLMKGTGGQWLRHFEILRTEGEAGMRRHWNERYCLADPSGLVHDPAPHRREGVAA